MKLCGNKGLKKDRDDVEKLYKISELDEADYRFEIGWFRYTDIRMQLLIYLQLLQMISLEI